MLTYRETLSLRFYHFPANVLLHNRLTGCEKLSQMCVITKVCYVPGEALHIRPKAISLSRRQQVTV